LRLSTRAGVRGAAIALTIALVPALDASAAAEALRPQPPRSSELRAAPDGGSVGALEDLGEPTPLPGGATQIFPANRVVALYGAPQMRATILGRLTPFEAWRRIRGESSRYRRLPGARPTVRGFELVVTIATADRGGDGRYRFRQTQATIARYLRAARQANARLILDIQPGRSPFTTEVRALRRWLREPDVDVALDPEWNVGPRGVPGRTDGSVDASTVNAVSDQLASIVREHRLPQKLLVIHQFRESSVRRASAIRRRPAVAPTLSFDGIGSARAKRAGYRALAEPGLFNGICLFYRLDDGLMSPSSVVALRPAPDYVLYQ
jgi:hypothetical protein